MNRLLTLHDEFVQQIMDTENKIIHTQVVDPRTKSKSIISTYIEDLKHSKAPHQKAGFTRSSSKQ